MKRFMPIVALIALALPASAIEVTTTAGQLAGLIEDTHVPELTVIGEMDARDFLFIACEMSQLTSLDLSGVNIVAYSDARPLTTGVYEFEAGTLPQSMLMGMKLETLVLPQSLTAIGYAALAGCDRLTSIELPSTLTTIGAYAFSGSALHDIVIPASVLTVGRGAFAHCFMLQNASIAAAEIGDEAFLGDYSLETVQLASSVRRIGDEAFHGTALQSLDASAATQLERLGSWAVASTPLTTVSLPEGLSQLGEGAFFGTRRLASVTLPQALTSVPDYAFAGGSQVLGDTLLHEGLTNIGAYAFYNWNDTRYFYIPSTVSHLGTQAMAGMVGLEQIDVAASNVPTLGDSVWLGVDQPSVKLGTPNNDTAELYAQAEQWQEFYILHDYLLGDVNGDGMIDVADVNLMINRMLGKESTPFIEPAADTDADGTIDVTDVNYVINLILQKEAQSTVRRVKARNGSARPTTDDVVTIEPFAIRPGETRTLELRLANTQDYEALQLDIILPAGIEMVDNHVDGTTRTARHSQLMRTHGERSRVVSYSMQGRAFANNDDALLKVRIRATDIVAPGACVMVSNVLLARDNTCYAAPDTSAPVSNTTGVDNLTVDNSSAYATGMTLVIESSSQTTVQVVSLNGVVRSLTVPQGHSEYNDLPAGVYVVLLQGKSYKVSLQ